MLKLIEIFSLLVLCLQQVKSSINFASLTHTALYSQEQQWIPMSYFYDTTKSRLPMFTSHSGTRMVMVNATTKHSETNVDYAQNSPDKLKALRPGVIASLDKDNYLVQIELTEGLSTFGEQKGIQLFDPPSTEFACFDWITTFEKSISIFACLSKDLKNIQILKYDIDSGLIEKEIIDITDDQLSLGYNRIIPNKVGSSSIDFYLVQEDPHNEHPLTSLKLRYFEFKINLETQKYELNKSSSLQSDLPSAKKFRMMTTQDKDNFLDRFIIVSTETGLSMSKAIITGPSIILMYDIPIKVPNSGYARLTYENNLVSFNPESSILSLCELQHTFFSGFVLNCQSFGYSLPITGKIVSLKTDHNSQFAVGTFMDNDNIIQSFVAPTQNSFRTSAWKISPTTEINYLSSFSHQIFYLRNQKISWSSLTEPMVKFDFTNSFRNLPIYFAELGNNFSHHLFTQFSFSNNRNSIAKFSSSSNAIFFEDRFRRPYSFDYSSSLKGNIYGIETNLGKCPIKINRISDSVVTSGIDPWVNQQLTYSNDLMMRVGSLVIGGKINYFVEFLIEPFLKIEDELQSLNWSSQKRWVLSHWKPKIGASGPITNFEGKDAHMAEIEVPSKNQVMLIYSGSFLNMTGTMMTEIQIPQTFKSRQWKFSWISDVNSLPCYVRCYQHSCLAYYAQLVGTNFYSSLMFSFDKFSTGIRIGDFCPVKISGSNYDGGSGYIYILSNCGQDEIHLYRVKPEIRVPIFEEIYLPQTLAKPGLGFSFQSSDLILYVEGTTELYLSRTYDTFFLRKILIEDFGIKNIQKAWLDQKGDVLTLIEKNEEGSKTLITVYKFRNSKNPFSQTSEVQHEYTWDAFSMLISKESFNLDQSSEYQLLSVGIKSRNQFFSSDNTLLIEMKPSKNHVSSASSTQGYYRANWLSPIFQITNEKVDSESSFTCEAQVSYKIGSQILTQELSMIYTFYNFKSEVKIPAGPVPKLEYQTYNLKDLLVVDNTIVKTEIVGYGKNKEVIEREPDIPKLHDVFRRISEGTQEHDGMRGQTIRRHRNALLRVFYHGAWGGQKSFQTNLTVNIEGAPKDVMIKREINFKTDNFDIFYDSVSKRTYLTINKFIDKTPVSSILNRYHYEITTLVYAPGSNELEKEIKLDFYDVSSGVKQLFFFKTKTQVVYFYMINNPLQVRGIFGDSHFSNWVFKNTSSLVPDNNGYYWAGPVLRNYDTVHLITRRGNAQLYVSELNLETMRFETSTIQLEFLPESGGPMCREFDSHELSKLYIGRCYFATHTKYGFVANITRPGENQAQEQLRPMFYASQAENTLFDQSNADFIDFTDRWMLVTSFIRLKTTNKAAFFIFDLHQEANRYIRYYELDSTWDMYPTRFKRISVPGESEKYELVGRMNPFYKDRFFFNPSLLEPIVEVTGRNALDAFPNEVYFKFTFYSQETQLVKFIDAFNFTPRTDRTVEIGMGISLVILILILLLVRNWKGKRKISRKLRDEVYIGNIRNWKEHSKKSQQMKKEEQMRKMNEIDTIPEIEYDYEYSENLGRETQTDQERNTNLI